MRKWPAEGVADMVGGGRGSLFEVVGVSMEGFFEGGVVMGMG